MAKDTRIFLRVEAEEKEKIQQFAECYGFDSVSAYILWVIRRDIKETEEDEIIIERDIRERLKKGSEEI